MTEKTKKVVKNVCIVIITVCTAVNLVFLYPKIKADYERYKCPYYEQLEDGSTYWKDVDKILNVSGKSQNGQRVTYTVHMKDSFYMKSHNDQLKIANAINKSLKENMKTNSVIINRNEDNPEMSALGYRIIRADKFDDFIVYKTLNEYKGISRIKARYKHWFADDDLVGYGYKYTPDTSYIEKEVTINMSRLK